MTADAADLRGAGSAPLSAAAAAREAASDPEPHAPELSGFGPSDATRGGSGGGTDDRPRGLSMSHAMSAALLNELRSPHEGSSPAAAAAGPAADAHAAREHGGSRSLERVCAVLGTTPELLRQRDQNAWLVLGAQPLSWLCLALAIYTWGAQTHWNAVYHAPLAIIAASYMVANPVTLRVDFRAVGRMRAFRAVATVRILAIASLTLLPIPGLVTLSRARWLPFQNPVIFLVVLFVTGWLALIVSHFHNPGQSTPRHRPPHVLVLACMLLVLRIVDPLADLALAARLAVNAATDGACPYRGRQACVPQVVVAGLIFAAAVCDLGLGWAVALVDPGALFPRLQKRTATIVIECTMLAAEGTIVAATGFMALSGMAIVSHSDDAAGGAGDKHDVYSSVGAYALMCSVATFAAMIGTILHLALPASFWQVVDEQGMLAAVCSNASRAVSTLRSMAGRPLGSQGGEASRALAVSHSTASEDLSAIVSDAGRAEDAHGTSDESGMSSDATVRAAPGEYDSGGRAMERERASVLLPAQQAAAGERATAAKTARRIVRIMTGGRKR